MRQLRGALTLLFITHALFVLGTQLPKDSVLQRGFERVASRYMKASGNWQGWDMFDSAPNFHAYRVELVAKMPGGSEQTFGPILPDLSEQTTYVRESTLFLRIIDGSYQLYAPGYAKNACAAVRGRVGTTPESVMLRQRIERTRALNDVRADGVIGTKSTTDGKTYPCGAP